LRVCLNSVDVPVVHSAPLLIDSARSIRGDVTADRRAHRKAEPEHSDRLKREVMPMGFRTARHPLPVVIVM